MDNNVTKAIFDGKNQRDWPSLPSDLVSKIADMLRVRHRVVMRCVCSSWYSTIPRQRLPSPWLLLPGLLGNNDEMKTRCTFFSVSENESIVSGYIPALNGKRCVGSSSGCLVLADDGGTDITVWIPENDYSDHSIHTVHPGTNPGKKYKKTICLEAYRRPRVPSITLPYMTCRILTAEFKTKLIVFDPLTGVTFQLPSYTNCPSSKLYSHNFSEYQNNIDKVLCKSEYNLTSFSVKKVVVSSNTPNDFIAVAIMCNLWKNNVAYVRAGDEEWTLFDTEMEYDDIVYHDGRFYGLAVDLARVNIFDFTTISPTITMIFKGNTEDHYFFLRRKHCKCYRNLVLSTTGEMFLILRIQQLLLDFKRAKCSKMCTTTIKVLRCNTCNRNPLDKVDDIKGQSFFIGNNNSISISSTDVPGLKSNCIYFTDTFQFDNPAGFDVWEGDVGVFNMETRSFECVGPPNACMNWPSPIWFEPSR